MKWAKVCLLALLADTASAQSPETRQTRDLSGRWVQYYATVYRVPAELVEAIIDEESGWNPYAVSRKGAVGIMQLMPGTAVRFGVRNRSRVDENIHGGVAYLACLKRRFNGDLRLITAAYYVGEYPISRRGLNYSSPDVQGYVKRVARRYRERRIARSELARQKQKLRWQDEKSSTFRLGIAVAPGGSRQRTADRDQPASSHESNYGPQGHHHRPHGPFCDHHQGARSGERRRGW